MSEGLKGLTGHPDEFGDHGGSYTEFEVPKKTGLLADLQRKQDREMDETFQMTKEEEFICRVWKEPKYMGNRANQKAKDERDRVFNTYWRRANEKKDEINERYKKLYAAISEATNEN